MCLEYLPALPNKGFHHSCHNLVEDMPRPQNHKLKDKPRPKFSAGEPENEAQATYTPSEVFKRQSSLMQEAQAELKRQKTDKMNHQMGVEQEARASFQHQHQQQNSSPQQQPYRQQPQLPDLRGQLQQQASQLQEQQYETPRDQQALPDESMGGTSTSVMEDDIQDLLNYEDDDDM